MAGAIQGLDRAAAPPADKARQMLDAIGGRWWNVYIGGPESGGRGWTPALVRSYAEHGIERFMLTYVGRQSRGPLTAAQGEADARDALRIAKGFGYGGSFPLCLDVELPTFESAPARAVEYARAWCAAVRAAGARPGVYANPGPLKAMAAARVPAEFVWVASWVGHGAAPHDPHAAANMPAGLWVKPGQRAWQYAGAFDHTPCRVLGLDVDISVADVGCLAPPPGAARRARLVRLGDAGPVVERLTRRLSYVRSRRTGEPFLDGRRSRLDAAAEAALKAFQREHGLADDGVYGRASAHALIAAARRERARRQGAGRAVAAREGARAARPAAGGLRALVDDVRRADAETARAWDALLAYGRLRRRLLARARARAAARGPGASGIAAILLRIERQLETLIALERREANGAGEQAPAPLATAASVAGPPGTSAPPPQASGSAPPTAASAQPQAVNSAPPAPAAAQPHASGPAPPAPPAAQPQAVNSAPPVPAAAQPQAGNSAPPAAAAQPQAGNSAAAHGAAQAAPADPPPEAAGPAPPDPPPAPPVLPPEAAGPAAPPAPPVPLGPSVDGAGTGTASPARVSVRLADLSDDELAERIERLDRALDRSRAVLMARYARVERRLAELAPAPVPARRPPPRRPPPRPAPPAPAATVDVRDLQRSLNEFTGRHLKGVSPLAVDGKNGPETRRRIRLAKHYLGYTGAGRRSTAVDAKLVPRLRHPRSARHSNPAMLARALTRRRDQRKAAGRATAARAGVVTFDGQPVAAWMEPYLRWAREHGWQGRLTSGWRDPAYSEQLCRAMCGAATCPGRCAGRTSNHVGRIRPAGAIDVTDEVRFAELMRRCPYSPRLFNDLPSDRIHFSATGH